MDESHLYSRILQAAVVEILSQVGFEKANRQALQILIDTTFDCINRKLIHIKQVLQEEELGIGINVLSKEEGAEEERKQMENLLQEIFIEKCTGPPDSYKREELLSFLQFQLNITKQIRREEGGAEMSLLEVLKGEEPLKQPEGTQGVVDFTEEEGEQKKELAEKKYLDQDVREYIEIYPQLNLEPKISITKKYSIEDTTLEKSIIKINTKRKDHFIKENMRDYEYMLARKRLSTKHCTPCEFSGEIPFLEDLLLLSTTRRPVKKRREKDQKERENTDLSKDKDATEKRLDVYTPEESQRQVESISVE